MKIKEIHDLNISMGINADFRGPAGVGDFLNRKRAQFERMAPDQKERFDQAGLKNPYLDSDIYNISEDREVRKIMVGIDIGPAEIMMARELGGIDLVIGHHPVGKGLASLGDVMHLQCDVLNHYGIPINIAERLMKERIEEVSRGVNPINHERTVDAARLMGVSLMTAHTTCDNLAAKFLKEYIARKAPQTVRELVDHLHEIPEYRKAQQVGAGPMIFCGSPDNRCGKIALTEITGGTEGSPKMFEKMSQAGIGTIVGMHMSEEGKKQAEEAHLNVIIAGHMSSDSLGVNLFLDELEKTGIEIIPCSGFIRVSRVVS